ncbi:MAG TPA: hypothetical protein VFI97_01885 [Arthrobacter sp.]|nr:hypothetical protein [Arthrobacter sp.]
MKKFLREDGPILIASLVITFIAFRAAESWGWHFIGSAVFAAAAGLISAVVIQGLVVLWHHNRSDPNKDNSETTEAEAQRAASAEAEKKEGETDWREQFAGENPSGDDGSASGTGAEESGPRGPVRRSEGYRSSLEDPD